MITEKNKKNNSNLIKVQKFRREMKNGIRTSKLKKRTLVGGLSALAGIINGFVGTGGGIILIFLFWIIIWIKLI